MSEITDAEQRGRDSARLTALENHAKTVNGSLERMNGQLAAFRAESSRENQELKQTVVAITAEKRSIISLQNRQVAFLAAIGTVIFLLIEHVH